MKPKTRMLMIAVLVAAWFVPAVRLERFCSAAWWACQEDQTLNAWNDVKYGNWLVAAYAVCLVVPSLLLFFWRIKTYLALLLLTACLFIAADVILRQPEEVVVLFPSMGPLRPVCWSGLAISVVGVIHFLHGRGSQQAASPNGGPATQPGNSGATEGPPSVG
jgi:hypothetical protein